MLFFSRLKQHINFKDFFKNFMKISAGLMKKLLDLTVISLDFLIGRCTDTGSFSRCSGVKRCKSGIFADTGNSHRDHSASALGSVHEELSASTVSRTAAMPHDRSAVTEVERQPAASHQQGCRGNALSSDVAYEEYVHTSSTLQVRQLTSVIHYPYCTTYFRALVKPFQITLM
jgi:hypothetical protein